MARALIGGWAALNEAGLLAEDATPARNKNDS